MTQLDDVIDYLADGEDKALIEASIWRDMLDNIKLELMEDEDLNDKA